jgi:hypothetical protein
VLQESIAAYASDVRVALDQCAFRTRYLHIGTVPEYVLYACCL